MSRWNIDHQSHCEELVNWGEKSALMERELQPQDRLTKAEIRSGLKISMWEGAASKFHSALTSNALLTGFALAWGASDFHIGLLGAIPFLGQLGQLAGAYAVDRWAERRRLIVAYLALVARGTWLLMAFLPFLVSGQTWLLMPAILFLFLSIKANRLEKYCPPQVCSPP
jgi:hypothetical protein